MLPHTLNVPFPLLSAFCLCRITLHVLALVMPPAQCQATLDRALFIQYHIPQGKIQRGIIVFEQTSLFPRFIQLTVPLLLPRVLVTQQISFEQFTLTTMHWTNVCTGGATCR